MINSYSPEQVLQALRRQGYTDEQSQALYEAMGDERKNSAQVKAGYRAVGAPEAGLPEKDDGEMDSSFMPNLVEGTAYAGLGPYAANKFASKPVQEGASKALGAIKNGGRWMARGGLPMAGAMAATTAAMALTGNRFYDQATPQQTLADMGGSMGGYMAGSALGRAAGTALGTPIPVVGPIVGGILGSALGGWLAPKLLPAGSKSVKEDDGREPSDKQAWGTLGAMGVAGGLAMNGKTRKMISDIIRRKKGGANPAEAPLIDEELT